MAMRTRCARRARDIPRTSPSEASRATIGAVGLAVVGDVDEIVNHDRRLAEAVLLLERRRCRVATFACRRGSGGEAPRDLRSKPETYSDARRRPVYSRRELLRPFMCTTGLGLPFPQRCAADCVERRTNLLARSTVGGGDE